MRVALLGSGKGSNAKAVLKYFKKNNLSKVQIVGIISDNEQSGILELGTEFEVEAQCINSGPFKTKLEGEAESAYIAQLKYWKTDLVVLAGFMRILKPSLLSTFPRRVINLHPSLLPSFKGLEAIKQAWEYGVKITGCTVHYVDSGIDTGSIIEQTAIYRNENDTLESFSNKIHEAEHQLLPKVIEKLSNND